MGLIREILGLGRVVGNVAEVFVPNKTQAQAQSHLRAMGAQTQFAAEFQHQRLGWFDRFIDGLNRLPRPIMALGTVGLFWFAMADPAAFTQRMQGLAYVPDPLWWLLGAVVSFYFGAREMHHYRRRSALKVSQSVQEPATFSDHSVLREQNPALSDWVASKNKSGEVS